MRNLYIVLAALALGGANLASSGCGPSPKDAATEKTKLKIVSLEDVQKWTHQTTRKEVHDLVSSEAVLLATFRVVMFKAKEGGAYSVSLAPKGDGGVYEVAAVYYLPKYPDISPRQAILRGEPLPNLPIKKGQ